MGEVMLECLIFIHIGFCLINSEFVIKKLKK